MKLQYLYILKLNNSSHNQLIHSLQSFCLAKIKHFHSTKFVHSFSTHRRNWMLRRQVKRILKQEKPVIYFYSISIQKSTFRMENILYRILGASTSLYYISVS